MASAGKARRAPLAGRRACNGTSRLLCTETVEKTFSPHICLYDRWRVLVRVGSGQQRGGPSPAGLLLATPPSPLPTAKLFVTPQGKAVAGRVEAAGSCEAISTPSQQVVGSKRKFRISFLNR